MVPLRTTLLCCTTNVACRNDPQMILDTSAMVAIFFAESECDRFLLAIHDADVCRISAANFVELGIVIEGQLGPQALRDCDEFLQFARIVIEPVTIDHAQRARQAFSRFGKGKHAAGLNFGDCFAYALASAAGEPLLFKGNDFAQTDIQAAANLP